MLSIAAALYSPSVLGTVTLRAPLLNIESPLIGELAHA